jgi:hypothetical protein
MRSNPHQHRLFEPEEVLEFIPPDPQPREGRKPHGRLRIVHIELNEANDFVERLHRHHRKTTTHRFSIGVADDDGLCGVAICSRPVARMTDASTVLEVSRVCTDGTKNACSVLYGAAARAAKELGYTKVQTFIMEGELASSLKASGWHLDGISPGGNWRSARDKDKLPDTPEHLQCPKQRWAKKL